MLAIGVSKYEAHELKYAAKDAVDIIDRFNNARASFDGVKILSLLDSQATRERIMAAKIFHTAAEIDDEVVVFVSGHGVLNERKDYYFATADMDFINPSKRGITYVDLEGLLDGLAARKKLLLIDTCYAGEVQSDARILQKNKGHEVASATKGITLSFSETNSILEEVFADLRRGTGAHVIAASRGVGTDRGDR